MAVITRTRYMLIERLNYLPRSLRMAFYIDCTHAFALRTLSLRNPPRVARRVSSIGATFEIRETANLRQSRERGREP